MKRKQNTNTHMQMNLQTVKSAQCDKTQSVKPLALYNGARPSVAVPSLLPLRLREYGTCYHWQSRHCRHCRLSSVHWRRNCFADRTTTHTSGNSSIDTSL